MTRELGTRGQSGPGTWHGQQTGGKGSPVVAGDNDTAGTGLLALLDEVGLLETLALVGGFELLGEIIVADTASVYDRALRKDVLGE